MSADKITIRIQNHNGRQGRMWDATYPTIEQAADAIRSEMGWTSVHVGDSVSETDGEGRTMRLRAVYDGEEAEEAEGDSRWAYAPKVVTTVESVD